MACAVVLSVSGTAHYPLEKASSRLAAPGGAQAEVE